MSFLNKTIESASASFILTLSDLFGPPIPIKGFSPDDMFDFDAVKPTEVVMGVDGVLSGGKINHPTVMKVHLAADSPSCLVFDAWYAAQQSTNKAYAAFAIVSLPGIGMMYACAGGWLTNHTPVSSAKKLLQPREFEITWQSVTPSPLSM